MENRRFDRLACAFAARTPRRGAFAVAVGIALGGLLRPGNDEDVEARKRRRRKKDSDCNCVSYLVARNLIPCCGLARNYEPLLLGAGFQKVTTPGAGDIMVLQPGTLGAGGLGHIALVTSASQDGGTGRWSIVVEHANWRGGAPIGGAGPCNKKGSARRTVFANLPGGAGPLSGNPGAAFYRR